MAIKTPRRGFLEDVATMKVRTISVLRSALILG